MITSNHAFCIPKMAKIQGQTTPWSGPTESKKISPDHPWNRQHYVFEKESYYDYELKTGALSTELLVVMQ